MGNLPAITAIRPLAEAAVRAVGPPALTDPALRHMRALGATTVESAPAGDAAHLTMGCPELGKVTADTVWADLCPEADVADEATAQATTGVMHVHGRRDGQPLGLAVDYAATCAAVATVQGLLAALLGQVRGGRATHVTCGADRAALLAVSQYIAAAGAPEAEAVVLEPGGPPFTASCGTRFELEALEPTVWAGFWRSLGTPEQAIRSGWRPFQFRYATACAPLPEELHAATRTVSWARIRQAAAASGAEVCRLHTLADRVAEATADAPWTFAPSASIGVPPPRDLRCEDARPLSGFTVLEAGRRIQAPLAAHLLGLLGADVIRVEPPGGDPLRGMPPCCSNVSARWLALNRGKRAIQIDVKSPIGQAELRELVAGADVFLHNWAPGRAERFGLDADHLAAVNPRLVHAYTSGWGGRLPGAPIGTDFMVQARTGVGEAARPADEPTAPSLMTLIDMLGGLLGAEAVLAALLLRERTGRGVRVESSLLGAAETLTAPALRRAGVGREARRPAGFRRPLPTADRWIAPTDDSARAANTQSGHLARLSSHEAVAVLRDQGLTATVVTTDLAALPIDPRLRGVLTRDPHGSLVVPSPWRFE
ncbi:CoA transferase [Streptomyces yunnanensis]|uniref:CoA-transferase family III n=1 Tax=Streptomyces yunnanensis TaxID=156453 RepID=A0A9X8QWL9_9ACTN|nr:CoA-transferase family III [Streptomyces yunnanensis]